MVSLSGADGGARRQLKGHAALIAAYREGLGFAAIVVTGDPPSLRVVAPMPACGDAAPDATGVEARWWCRRASDAERVRAAATTRLRRRQSCDDATQGPEHPSGRARNISLSTALIEEAMNAAAEKLNVALYSDGDIAAEAEAIIARVEAEIEALRSSGQFKSVNRSYRAYRIEASARGEKVAPYAEWLNKYKANLVRRLADALRYA
jgi:hypothetical protein